MADENILSLLDIAGLIYRRCTGTLSPIESMALEFWLAANPANQALDDELSPQDWVDDNLAALDPVALRASVARVYRALDMEAETPVVPIARRPLFRISRWIAAASVLAILAAGAWLGLRIGRLGGQN
jgi:hypothetical protein